MAMCGVNGCPYRVTKTDTGWAHVDTHGVLPGHRAVPPGLGVSKEDAEAAYSREQAKASAEHEHPRSLYTRLVEYRDNMVSIAAQLDGLKAAVVFKGGDTTPLDDGIKFYTTVAGDLTKIINGEELKGFVVTGVLE